MEGERPREPQDGQTMTIFNCHKKHKETKKYISSNKTLTFTSSFFCFLCVFCGNSKSCHFIVLRLVGKPASCFFDCHYRFDSIRLDLARFESIFLMAKKLTKKFHFCLTSRPWFATLFLLPVLWEKTCPPF